MMMMTLLLMVIKNLILNFSKKLLVLLNLEVSMMWLILFFSNSLTTMNFNIYILMTMMMFMVMDSVYGISVLLSTSRNSSIYSFMFKI